MLDIFRKYAADEDIHMYSIDEGMIDMTRSWHLFGNDPYYVARKMQKIFMILWDFIQHAELVKIRF